MDTSYESRLQRWKNNIPPDPIEWKDVILLPLPIIGQEECIIRWAPERESYKMEFGTVFNGGEVSLRTHEVTEREATIILAHVAVRYGVEHLPGLITPPKKQRNETVAKLANINSSQVTNQKARDAKRRGLSFFLLTLSQSQSGHQLLLHRGLEGQPTLR